MIRPRGTTTASALALGLAGLLVSASAAPAWAGRAKRKSRRAQPAQTQSRLGEPLFTSYIEFTGPPEPDLRDAPAPVATAPDPPPAAGPPDTLLDRLVAGRNVGPRSVDASACADAARNLRFIVGVARSDLKEGAGPVAKRKFVSGLKRELELLQRSQPPDESEIAVLATEAEMELEAALKELDQRPLGADTLSAASRAASNLDSAARLFSH